MVKSPQTASAAIGFAKALEEDSAKFYEDLSQRYAQDKDGFLSLAKENRKNAAQVERAYYEVISDAIEGCFAFNLNPDKYTVKTELAEETSYSDALKKAVEIEEKIIKFYLDASEMSRALIGDVSRAFDKIAKKRGERIHRLKSLLTDRAR
ncbi:unnamed protein product [marine sediment metagenome]|uniref:Rubrerythrin diiron-binding domain-containing protein n=1 Tax=marine sediment metagenome TaxID=412755 RepID=X1LSD0_9ZZZZ